MGRPAVDADVRFAAKVARRGPDDCWPWTAALSNWGYGVFAVSSGRFVRAHRYAYEKAFGSIPDRRVIDHTCHNNSGCASVPCPHRACCNPTHLEAVTQSVNTRRGRTGEHMRGAKTTTTTTITRSN